MSNPSPNPGSSHTSLREVKAAGGRWGLDEFVEVVNSLVERYLPASRSFNIKLRDAFNPRLVRYYATFGLISPPEREGKEARYHYGHLLQALVIRRLLFEGYTAPVLLKMLAGKTEADYEAMLAGGVSMAAAAVPREEVDGHIAAAGPPEHLRLVRDLMAAAPPCRPRRRSRRRRRPSPPPRAGVAAARPGPPARKRPSGGGWRSRPGWNCTSAPISLCPTRAPNANRSCWPCSKACSRAGGRRKTFSPFSDERRPVSFHRLPPARPEHVLGDPRPPPRGRISRRSRTRRKPGKKSRRSSRPASRRSST